MEKRRKKKSFCFVVVESMKKRRTKKSYCFVVVEFEFIFCHPCFYVICACTELFGEVVSALM